MFINSNQNSPASNYALFSFGRIGGSPTSFKSGRNHKGITVVIAKCPPTCSFKAFADAQSAISKTGRCSALPPPAPTDSRCGSALRWLWLFLLLKLEDARVGLIGHFRQYQQVVASEALRRLPLIAVLVEAAEGDVVPRAVDGFVSPDCSLDGADSDFSNGFRVIHDVFLLIS